MIENNNNTIRNLPETLHNLLVKIIFGENIPENALDIPLNEENQKTIFEFLQLIENRRLSFNRKQRRKIVKERFSKHVKNIYKSKS